MKKLIIFGIGEYAQIAHFYFTHDSEYEVVGFTVDSDYLKRHGSDTFFDLPVVAFEEVERIYSPSEFEMFIAIGFSRLNLARYQKFIEAKQKQYQLASYLSSKATVWPGLMIGENCFILEDNTIQPFVKLGNNIVLWSGNHIGHHAEIANNCFISSHVVISGGVSIGENSFIGVNATIRDHVSIAKNCVIAAGALILKSTAENGIYRGSPAKIAKISSQQLKII